MEEPMRTVLPQLDVGRITNWHQLALHGEEGHYRRLHRLRRFRRLRALRRSPGAATLGRRWHCLGAIAIACWWGATFCASAIIPGYIWRVAVLVGGATSVSVGWRVSHSHTPRQVRGGVQRADVGVALVGLKVGDSCLHARPPRMLEGTEPHGRKSKDHHAPQISPQAA